MTKKSLFQTATVTVFLLFITVTTFAQDSFIKNRWNLKLSGAPELIINNRLHPAFLMAEANYGIFNHFEAGIALGFENPKGAKLKPNPSNPRDIYTDYYISPIYNIHVNYHLVPYLSKEKESRFDVYLTGKLGGAYLESDFNDQSFFWNYNLGGGLGWYFTQHIGVYTEYGKQWPFKGISHNKAGLRLGLACKF